MADALKNEFDTINDVALISGKRGEFTVWLGDTLLARKDYNGFPAPEDVVAAMRKALAG